jgi:hypothetical protein
VGILRGRGNCEGGEGIREKFDEEEIKEKKDRGKSTFSSDHLILAQWLSI